MLKEMNVELPVLPTTVIGSYPRPRWLVYAVKLYRAGRIGVEELREAFDDAVQAVVREQEEVGIDIPSDGEMRRDDMVEYFAERIRGFRFYGPVRVWGNNFFNKPAVVSRLVYEKPIVVEEFQYLRRVSSRRVLKVTVTGPYTIADWSYNEYYPSKEDLVFELAKIINAEIKRLEEAGALFVQVDEPALTTSPKEMEWAIDAVNEVTKGVNIKLGIHICYGNYELLANYFDRLRFSQLALEFANRGFRDIGILDRLGDKEVGLGVIDVHSRKVETPEEVAKALNKAFKYVKPEQIYVNPDCGLKLLPRKIARAKLENMVRGVEIVRKELRERGLDRIPLKR